MEGPSSGPFLGGKGLVQVRHREDTATSIAPDPLDTEQAPAPSPTSTAALHEALILGSGDSLQTVCLGDNLGRYSSEEAERPVTFCSQSGVMKMGPWVGSAFAEWSRGLSLCVGLSSMLDEDPG